MTQFFLDFVRNVDGLPAAPPAGIRIPFNPTVALERGFIDLPASPHDAVGRMGRQEALDELKADDQFPRRRGHFLVEGGIPLDPMIVRRVSKTADELPVLL